MKVTQMPPVHVANLVANSGNIAYGVDVISLQSTIGTIEKFPGTQNISISNGFSLIKLPKWTDPC